MNYVCKRHSVFVLVIVLVLSGVLLADVRLPSVISDNMVLQQGKAVPIWGWADPCETVTVTGSWGSGKWETTADQDGKWMVKIDTGPSTSLGTGKAGGPYEMTVAGKNTVTVKDILVGEVWVCSGQSNMEFTVKQAKNSAEEIADANNYPQIRQFQCRQEGDLYADVQLQRQVAGMQRTNGRKFYSGWLLLRPGA